MAEENNTHSGKNNISSEKYLTEADDSKKLFVGGLHWETTDDDLKDYFSTYGPVDMALVKVDKFSGRSRGFGFILFEDTESVQKVLDVNEHVIGGKKIDPKPAQAPKEMKRKLFVGGVDPEIDEQQIRDYFSTFGKVDSVELPIDKTSGKRRAYVFISFATESEAKAATETSKHEIGGKMCDVRFASTPEQANRSRGWNQGSQYGYYGAYGGYNVYDYGYPPSYDYSSYDQGYYDSYGYDYYGGGYGDPYQTQPHYGPPPPNRGPGGKMSSSNYGTSRGGYHPYYRQ